MQNSKAQYRSPQMVFLGHVKEVTKGRKTGKKTDSSDYGTYYLNSFSDNIPGTKAKASQPSK